MCGFELADLASTLHALQGGAVELNPLIAPHGVFSLERLLIAKALAILACAFLVYRKSRKNPETQYRRMMLLCCLLLVISLSNWTF